MTALDDLAPKGVLRAGINLGNILLVTDSDASGAPVGVSPDMAAQIADRLGVALDLVPYASPGAVADAAGRDEWDIALIAADPKRAETIAFAPAYVEIEATYLVPAGSTIDSITDIDRPGVRIAVSGRSAYDLWLSRNLTSAELVRGDGLDGALHVFVEQGLDALAGLRPALRDNAAAMPGARVLDGRYMSVQQAIGCHPDRAAGLAFLKGAIADLTANGTVEGLLVKHGVAGKLQVAAGV